MPDLTVLLDVSAAKAQERLASRGSAGLDRIEGKGADYHARVGAAFRNLASAEPDRFAVIDADQTVDVVHDRIAAAVLRLLVAD